MPTFRKKPIIIEARQLFLETMEEIMKWCGGTYWSRPPMRAITGIQIKTLEGVMEASYGDWIIQGVNGEFYPCKPDIFEKTYEEVTVIESKKSATITLLADGAHLIQVERTRQILEEGYSRERDAIEYVNRQLVYAGLVYGIFAGMCPEDRDQARLITPGIWPWDPQHLKIGQTNSNQERIRELTKAGALFAAEIDRILREDAINDLVDTASQSTS